MVRYRKIVSQSKAFNKDFRNRFEQLAISAPDFEGGIRARIKTYDIDIMQSNNPETYSYLGDSYKRVAGMYLDRFISEEAYFKAGLSYYLAGESDKSVDILMKLLREFQSGALRETTQALLLEVLPDELKRLSEKKQYRELLILAQKNADLFSREWMDNESIANVANAYLTLGLYEEAHKLYLHLVSTGSLPVRQKAFLPLIKSAYEAGMYDRVDDYATRYKFYFPEDSDNDQILLYQAKALFSIGKYQRALNILPTPIPDSTHLQRLGINIYFYNSKYTEVLELMKSYSPEDKEAKIVAIFIKAESLYQTDQKDKAYKLFKSIPEDSAYWPQAMYRQGDYLRLQNRIDEAITVLKKLITASEDSNWAKLAQQDIKLIQTSSIN